MLRRIAVFLAALALSCGLAVAQNATPQPAAAPGAVAPGSTASGSTAPGSTAPGANPKPGPVTTKAPAADYFIGSWGTVSFNDEGDVGRMIQVARGYCNLPYKINRRTPETFEMYVAEKLTEVKLLEQDNRVYIVPLTPEGQRIFGARELTVRDANTFSVRYLENANHTRYGLNVFVRCGKQAG